MKTHIKLGAAFVLLLFSFHSIILLRKDKVEYYASDVEVYITNRLQIKNKVYVSLHIHTFDYINNEYTVEHIPNGYFRTLVGFDKTTVSKNDSLYPTLTKNSIDIGYIKFYYKHD